MALHRKNEVVIIDYGMGNLFSVKLACEKVGLDALISNKKSDIINAPALILPGVGAFGEAMVTLKNLDLVAGIKKFIDSGKPFLGICLGMQLLMTESEEFGLHKGLDIVKGKVKKFPRGIDKIPQVGWNQIHPVKSAKGGVSQDAKQFNRVKKSANIDWKNTLLKGVSEKEYMYFVHSFYCKPDDEEIILSKTNYSGLDYCSSLQKGNVFACQFHPEKSGENGLIIYKNLAKIIKK